MRIIDKQLQAFREKFMAEGELLVPEDKDDASDIQAFIKDSMLAVEIEVKKEIEEKILEVQPDLPDEMKEIVDDYDDYVAGIMDAKLKMLNSLSGRSNKG